MILYKTLTVTTDSSGAGTVTDGPINGEIIEVCSSGTALSGTADFTIVRAGTFGGTILAVADKQVPWWYQPRAVPCTVAGVAITNGEARIPCDGNVTLTVAQAGSVLTAAVTIMYDNLHD